MIKFLNLQSVDKDISRGSRINQLAAGSTFTCQLKGFEPSVYLKIYGGIVDLKNPMNTWTTFHPESEVMNFKLVEVEAIVTDEG